MKYALCVTLACNMSCAYCYIKRRESHMSDEIAVQSVDFMYNTTPPQERIEIGFFGGEPLLRFDTVEKIVRMVHERHAYADHAIDMTLVTNATLLTGEIIERLVDWGVSIGVSCDGPLMIQDRFRRFADGSATSAIVEKNLRLLASTAPGTMVNAVYRPETASYLPETVDYFSSLGIRRIYLSPDYSAQWTKQDFACLTEAYDAIGKRYRDFVRAHNPHFISLIDGKIPVIAQGGYREREQCLMGRGEFAISAQGNLFPCERLIDDGSENGHCIGNLATGPQFERMRCHLAPENGFEGDRKCTHCELRQYCMYWCGCSNFFATGFYNRVSEFLCFSERAALQTAMKVLEEFGEALCQ